MSKIIDNIERICKYCKWQQNGKCYNYYEPLQKFEDKRPKIINLDQEACNNFIPIGVLNEKTFNNY